MVNAEFGSAPSLGVGMSRAVPVSFFFSVGAERVVPFSLVRPTALGCLLVLLFIHMSLVVAIYRRGRLRLFCETPQLREHNNPYTLGRWGLLRAARLMIRPLPLSAVE